LQARKQAKLVIASASDSHIARNFLRLNREAILKIDQRQGVPSYPPPSSSPRVLKYIHFDVLTVLSSSYSFMDIKTTFS
jgi:hypothetical protein